MEQLTMASNDHNVNPQSLELYFPKLKFSTLLDKEGTIFGVMEITCYTVPLKLQLYET